MNLHSPNKSKTGSKKLQPKGASKGPSKAEQPPSNFSSNPGEKLSFDSLTKRIWPVFAESLKLENFPLVVLFVLAAVSLISRVWLMLH
jgi:hypothetical protein